MKNKKDNKMSIRIRDIISKFGITIGIILFSICYIAIVMQGIKKEWNLVWMLFATFALICIMSMRITFFSKRVYGLILLGICFQMVVGYLAMVEYEVWDVCAVYESAVALATEKGNFLHTYFEAHPNNIMLLFVLTGLYKVVYTLFGTTTVYAAIVLNVLFVDVGLFFAYKIAQVIGGNELKHMYVILCFLFTPFYLWTPIVYTDTMCFPFLTGAIYILIKAVREKNNLLFVGFGFIVALGIEMKGSLAILLVSGIIYLLLSWNVFNKDVIGKLCKALVCCFTGFFVGSIMFSSVVNATGLFSEENFYKYKYPKSHYVMMGLKGMGNFDGEDNGWTSSIEGYDEKKEAISEEIKRRIEEGGGISFVVKQMFNKAINYGWNYGTYYAERYLGDFGDMPVCYNGLHEIILSRGKYFKIHWLYSQGFYLVIFGMGICSYFIQIINKKINFEIMFLEISLLGALLFFMLWETHPRYLFHLSPVLLLTAAYSFMRLQDGISRLVEKSYAKNHKDEDEIR